MSAYAELHACSAFSFLRGATFPEHLAERAAELELPRSRCSIATASTEPNVSPPLVARKACGRSSARA